MRISRKITVNGSEQDRFRELTPIHRIARIVAIWVAFISVFFFFIKLLFL
jgi:hypothetical protein